MRNEQVADQLHAAAIRLLRFMRKEDAASGITGAQLSVLSVLAYGGPQTLGALAAAEQVKPPTMSQLVSGLEQLELVTRKPLDRRSAEISLTRKGRQLLEAGRKRRLARLMKAIDRLPAEQIDKLAQAAGLIVAITDPTL
ncbi:MAG TPA: MarR family transcriptional regulator [Rhizomicrobium sp.]|nr:MarR family transcriptional regulator [Rhizomicrobium sp.]